MLLLIVLASSSTVPSMSGASSRSTSTRSPSTSGALSWSDAKSLKLALNERLLNDPSVGLQPEELKIARILVSKMLCTGGGIQKIVFPKIRGQNENLTFYRKPTAGARGSIGTKGSKATRKAIVCLIEELCNECGILATDLLKSLEEKSRKEAEGNEKKILIEQSLALMKLAGLSENAYHQIRVFTKDILKIKWGASLDSIQRYLKVAIPPGDVFSTIESLQVGSTESSNHRKFKNCTVWWLKYWWEVLANRIKFLYNIGMFEPSSSFSNLEDDTILTVSNIDKADKFTSCMVRILNEKNGNSGKSTVILGVIGDNANECHENLSKTFFSENSPIKSALQMLLDDTLVVMHILLRSAKGEISQECCILHCLIADHYRAFPGHRHIKVLNVSDNKFLKSSEKFPVVEKIDDFSNFCLLRHTQNNSIVAAAVLNCVGVPFVWIKIGDDADRLSDAEVTEIQWKRLRGWEGSDNKMCSILSGHQGASSKFSCYCCTNTREEMSNERYECKMRTGERSNLALYEKYRTFRGSTGPADDNARRDECFNISSKPLLDVPIEKQMFAPSHTTTGNMAHLDSLIVKGLEEIEKKSSFYTESRSLQTNLAKHYEEMQSELKIRKRNQKKKRLEFLKFERIVGKNNAGNNPVYSKQMDDLGLELLRTDSQLKDLLEYSSIIKEGLENIQQYLDGKSDSLSVTCLNQCYSTVAEVCLGRYQGGRNFLFRDARSVATQFDRIAKCYIDLIEKLNRIYSLSFDLKAIERELSKATACTHYLGPLCIMSESQNKVNWPQVMGNLLYKYSLTH